LPLASTLTPEQAAEVAPPAPQIAGYEILGELAAAGQGRVWKARQLSTRREVALKVPRVDLLRSRVALTRFEREVELTARLNHPNIARIYDSGVHQGLYYYAMELIDGVWLDVYAREHSLSAWQILQLMQIICDAIQHAHQHGVLHRDLKPSNILVTKDGQPHVVDFGLAVALGAEAPAATVSLEGELTGTPAYMSPEQAAGLRDLVDTRTDVYSLGVVFYRLITGSFPYDVSTSVLATLQNIRQRDPVRPSQKVRHLDRDIEAILLKALAKEPERRYQSVAELKGDIDRRLAGLPVLARSDSSLYLLRKFLVKHRYTSTVAALLVIIVLGFLGFSLELNSRLQQTNRELRQQREFSLEQVADFTRYAQTELLVRFLAAWQKDDAPTMQVLAEAFAEGTGANLAVRFLQDPRPLGDKLDEFRRRLQKGAPALMNCIVAEQCRKDGDRSQAMSFYRACLSDRDLEQRDPLLALWAKNRLHELTDDGRDATPSGESEAKKK
jgi:serine/threonine protein kinase